MDSKKTIESGKDRLLLAILKECAPGVFEACELLSQPIIKDWSLIPKVHELIQQEEGETTCENIHIALAILDRLFVPIQLISNKLVKKPIGLRDEYSKLFGYENPENINSWAEIMRAHYKNPRFAEHIDQIAFEVYDFLKRNGDITDNTTVFAPSAHPFENFKTDGFLAKMVRNRVSGVIAHIEGAENSLLY